MVESRHRSLCGLVLTLKGAVLPKSQHHTAQQILGKLKNLTGTLSVSNFPTKPKALNQLRKDLEEQINLLSKLADRLDPVLKPVSLFDPGNPETSARIIALATIAQPRHPLDAIKPFYGSGVYALYYRGDFEPYAGLKGKEQPIYVGKADPVDRHANDAVSQGKALFNRLNEHAKSIRSAETTLNVSDFDCRFLVVQSGFQASAESKLINFFKPIWNNECGICYGIGKHGDSSKTRANKRSPWDTLHPGRRWAESLREDQKTRTVIINEIRDHLNRYPPKETVSEILEEFVCELRQLQPAEFIDATGKTQDLEELGNPTQR